jgi:hypothetical protein
MLIRCQYDYSGDRFVATGATRKLAMAACDRLLSFHLHAMFTCPNDPGPIFEEECEFTETPEHEFSVT